MDRIPASDDSNRLFISIRLSYDNTRLLPLEEGLQLLKLLANSVQFEKDYGRENDYAVRFVHESELNEMLVDRLLGRDRDDDREPVATAA